MSEFNYNEINKRAMAPNLLKSYGVDVEKANIVGTKHEPNIIHDTAEKVGVQKGGNKHDFSTKEREKLSTEHEAMSGGSFPIRNEQDLKDAIKSVGRAKDYEKAKFWIKKRAKELNKESILPEDWKSSEEKAMTTSNTPGKETAEGPHGEIVNIVPKNRVEKGGDNTDDGMFLSEDLTPTKAKTMLSDNSANGKELTDKQKRFFGFVAGGGKPMKKGQYKENQETKEFQRLEDEGVMFDNDKDDKVKKAFEVLGVDMIEKAEGGRGGKIIGHTKSGKAIYGHYPSTIEESTQGFYFR